MFFKSKQVREELALKKYRRRRPSDTAVTFVCSAVSAAAAMALSRRREKNNQPMDRKVCEMWWTQDRPGAEHLVVHLIPVMLVRSLSPDAKEADVKRMHG